MGSAAALPRHSVLEVGAGRRDVKTADTSSRALLKPIHIRGACWLMQCLLLWERERVCQSALLSRAVLMCCRLLEGEGVLANIQIGPAQQAHSVIVSVAAAHNSIHHRLWPCKGRPALLRSPDQSHLVGWAKAGWR